MWLLKTQIWCRGRNRELHQQTGNIFDFFLPGWGAEETVDMPPIQPIPPASTQCNHSLLQSWALGHEKCLTRCFKCTDLEQQVASAVEKSTAYSNNKRTRNSHHPSSYLSQRVQAHLLNSICFWILSNKFLGHWSCYKHMQFTAV